jgi:hypothetical protein
MKQPESKPNEGLECLNDEEEDAAITIKIKLKCFGRTEILKDVPAKFKENNPNSKEILLASILSRVKKDSKIL